MRIRLIKLILLSLLILVLSLTACVSRSRGNDGAVSVKIFDGLKAELKSGTLNIYTLEDDIKTYSVQIDGLEQSVKRNASVNEERLAFLIEEDGLYKLYAASRKGAFKQNDIIGSIKTDVKSLNKLTVVINRITNVREVASASLARPNTEGTKTILGDYDYDLIVDLDDFNTFVDVFGTDSEAHKISPATDTTGDGLYDTRDLSDGLTINEDDFTVFANNFGMGDMWELYKAGKYTESFNTATAVSENIPEYADAYLIMFLNEWQQVNGPNFLIDQAQNMMMLSNGLIGISPSDWSEMVDHLNTSLPMLDRFYKYLTDMKHCWEEGRTVQILMNDSDRLLSFDGLTIEWLLGNIGVFRGFANFITAYDFAGDYPMSMEYFDVNSETGIPYIDLNEDGTITPEEIYSVFPLHFGELNESGQQKLNDLKECIAGFGSAEFTNAASEILSTYVVPTASQSRPYQESFIAWDIRNRFSNYPGVIENALGTVVKLNAFFEGSIPQIVAGNDTTIVLNYFYDLFATPTTAAAERVVHSVTVNFTTFFDAGITDLMSLFVPTVDYSVSPNFAGTDFEVEATFAFSSATFNGLVPNGETDLNTLFDFISTADASSTVSLNLDQDIWVQPSENVGPGVTFKIYGIDNQMVERFMLLIPEADVFQLVEGGEITFDRLPNREVTVIVAGVSKETERIDSKLFAKNFLWQKKVDLSDSDSPERGMSVGIYAQDVDRNVKFNISDQTGTALDLTDIVSIVMKTSSSHCNDYGKGLGDKLLFAVGDFYPAAEWVKMDADAISLVDAQLKTKNAEIYDESGYSLVFSSDNTIDIEPVNMGELTVDSAAIEGKEYDKVWFIPSEGWIVGKPFGFEFTDTEQFDLTGDKEYRIVYQFMKQNAGDEYYRYMMRYADGEDMQEGKIYLQNAEAKTISFTDEDWKLNVWDVVEKKEYKIGERISGRIFAKDALNNTLFAIDKHVNSSLQGAETGYVSAFSDGTADESAEEDFNWDEFVFENRVKPSFEVIDQDGLTVHKGEGVYVDWIIPSHLKTGKYTVLFRWDTGSVAGVLQKSLEIFIGESAPDFAIIPELWNDRDNSGTYDSELLFMVKLYDRDLWNDADVYVNGPDIRTSDRTDSGIKLEKEDWGEVIGFKGHYWNKDNWPAVGDEYTVSIYRNGNLVDRITDQIDFLFGSLPYVMTPQDQQHYDAVQDVSVEWASLPGAAGYSVMVEKKGEDKERFFEETERNSLIIPKEYFEDNSAYSINVMAHRNLNDVSSDSRAVRRIDVKFGTVDDFRLHFEADYNNISDRTGFYIEVDYYDENRAAEAEHIWLSGPGISGGRIDLKNNEGCRTDDCSRFSTYYDFESYQIKRDDVYRVLMEYKDDTSEYRDVKVIDDSRVYPDVAVPQENQVYDTIQNVPVEWYESGHSDAARDTTEHFYEVSLWKIEENNAHNAQFIYGQNLNQNESGHYFYTIPASKFEMDRRYYVVVSEWTIYEDVPYFMKKISEFTPVVIGDPALYKTGLDLEAKESETDGTLSYKLEVCVEPTGYSLFNPIEKVEFEGPGVARNEIEFHGGWNNGLGSYQELYELENPQTGPFFYTVYFRDGTTEQFDSSLPVIPQQLPTITYPEVGQVFSLEEASGVSISWDSGLPELDVSEGNYRVYITSTNGLWHSKNELSSPYDIGNIIKNRGDGIYTVEVIAEYMGEDFDVGNAFAVSKRQHFIIGDPYRLRTDLKIYHYVRNGNDEDDYYKVYSEVKYFDDVTAQDVNGISVKDSRGYLDELERLSYDQRRFTTNFEPEQNPEGSLFEFGFDYQTNPDATITYFVDEVFDAHPSIIYPERDATITGHEDFTVVYTPVEGAQQYYCVLYYRTSPGWYWVKSLSKNDDANNSFTFDKSVFETYGDGIYEVKVYAKKWLDLGEGVSSRESEISHEIEAMTYRNGEGWQRVNFVDNRPEEIFIIPSETFDNDEMILISRTEDLKGNKQLYLESESERSFRVGDDVLPFEMHSEILYRISNGIPKYKFEIDFISTEFVNSLTQAYVEGPAINGRRDFNIHKDSLHSEVSLNVPTSTLAPGDEYVIVLQTSDNMGYTATQTVPDYPRNASSVDWQTNIVDNHLNAGQDLEVSWQLFDMLDYTRIAIKMLDEKGNYSKTIFDGKVEGNTKTFDAALFEEGIYYLELYQRADGENGHQRVIVYADRLPFTVGDATDYIFRMTLNNMGDSEHGKWDLRFEINFYGKLSADDVETVLFDGPALSEPIGYNWKNEAQVVGYVNSSEACNIGDVYSATIYAKPESVLAKWLEMKNSYLQNQTTRTASGTVYATSTVTVTKVPEILNVLAPVKGTMLDEATDISVEWEQIGDTSGYWIGVNQYDYDGNHHQGSVWGQSVTEYRDHLVIPSQTFDNGHMYAVSIHTNVQWDDRYGFYSSNHTWFKVGDPVIENAYLDYIYYAEGDIGSSEITEKIFVMWIDFYDDLTYQEVKDTLHFETSVTPEEDLSGLTTAYYSDNARLRVEKTLPLESVIYDGGSWAKLYGLRPDGRTFHTVADVHNMPSLPVLQYIEPYTSEGLVNFLEISWNKGIGTCNDQYLEVWKDSYEGEYIGRFELTSADTSFRFERDSDLSAGDKYCFKLYTIGNELSVLSFDYTIPE
jgi:hypothetical protein